MLNHFVFDSATPKGHSVDHTRPVFVLCGADSLQVEVNHQALKNHFRTSECHQPRKGRLQELVNPSSCGKKPFVSIILRR